ncbi:MAG: phage tail protein [Sphingomonas sp.]
MAKAFKIIGTVAALGALAIVTAGAGLAVAGGLSLAGGVGFVSSMVGVSITTLGLVAGGASLAAGLLTKAPSVPSSQTQRLIASVDPRAFRKTVLGQTAMATDIRYEEWSGKDQEYCDWIICVASHAIDGVEEIWIDQEMAWSATTGVVGKYAGYFWVPNIILEGSPANAFTFGSGKWNGNTRLTGCAYLRLRFKLTGNGKKTESPFVGGISTRLTIIGRGAKLYDPRRDSTVPGGSGPMRWNDQSTWRYTADDGAVIGENLALQILRVVLGWRIRNPSTGVMRLATGSGVPGRRIGMTSFQIAANLCDELVNRSAGGQEPRYHGAGVISEGDDPKTILDMLCAACCGRFRDTGGKLELVIAHNDLAAAAADDGLNEDDVVGPFTWDPDPSLEETPNILRGRYVDATPASLYQLIDFPEIRIPSLDGQDRIATLDLGVVESPSQAQRVGRQVLQRMQYKRTFSAPFDIRAWKYGVGDVVPFTFAPLGFKRALFRVADQEQGQGSTCQMTLTVEHQAIYAWDASDKAPVQAADPIVYDRGNNPLILAIGEAAETALWSGVTGPGKPADNATVGAPAGTPVGDRLAEEINRLTDLNGWNLIGEIARADALLALTNAKLYIDGNPIGAVIGQVQEKQESDARSFAQNFSFLGARNGDNSGWILNGDSVIATPDSLNVTSLKGIVAEVAGHSIDITDLKEVLYDASGLTIRAVNLIDLDGNISGTVNTQNGEVGDYAIYANVFRIVNPNGGQPFTPFSIGADGTVEMISVRVKTLAYEALVPLFGGPYNELTPNYTVQQLPGGLLRMTGKLRGSIGSETPFNIVWPRVFPNACVARGAQVWNANYSTTSDLWIENIGEPTPTHATFATQAARGDVSVNIGGVDWWAEGY